ncbi:HEAT repeat domain-containing protein [Streptomyces sp. JJ36]|uniref:HEAT repeat domain-containing protein n=1 Tax=Streptomyces sp. JJ36 TaxID=2736645 RepID=UPI001F1605FA|nr:HEAT repeat domain-containing protein [Streptomyces sp. JJ36]MCF6522178.1 hypothetical protein [Streptomyces sp. JJ36]
MGESGLGDRLRSAVRAGDAQAVRALTEQGAPPDTADAAGLPVLCAAVAAYDAEVAAALVEGGADPDRVLPDGSTPLWRAVDGGSPAVVSAVLGTEPRLRLPEAARHRLLHLARDWYETGAAEKLRRRTGDPGPATTVRVQDDAYDRVDEVSLGGHVVRAGHGAVLTSLEWAFRVLTPVGELIGRAVEHPDETHVTWSAVSWVLLQRRSRQTWSAVVAHRHHPAPAHRRLAAEYLRMHALCHPGGHDDAEKRGTLLASWAAEETDGGVLAKVVAALTEDDHPGQEPAGLRHAGHTDPRVRREVPHALAVDGVPRSPAARDALHTLLGDPDARVRISACSVGMRDDGLLPAITRALLVLAGDRDAGVRGAAAAALAASPDRTPRVADTLVSLLDEENRLVRLEAAHGLALRDDPRTAEAIARVGPLPPGFDDDHRAHALWRWRRRQEDAPGT